MTLESTMRPTEHPSGSDTLLPTNHIGNGSPGTSLSERSRAGATPVRSVSTREGGREAMSFDNCVEVIGRGKGDILACPLGHHILHNREATLMALFLVYSSTACPQRFIMLQTSHPVSLGTSWECLLSKLIWGLNQNLHFLKIPSFFQAGEAF